MHGFYFKSQFPLFLNIVKLVLYSAFEKFSFNFEKIVIE